VFGNFQPKTGFVVMDWLALVLKRKDVDGSTVGEKEQHTVDQEDNRPLLGSVGGHGDVRRDASYLLFVAFWVPVLDLAREAARGHSYAGGHCGGFGVEIGELEKLTDKV